MAISQCPLFSITLLLARQMIVSQLRAARHLWSFGTWQSPVPWSQEGERLENDFSPNLTSRNLNFSVIIHGLPIPSTLPEGAAELPSQANINSTCNLSMALRKDIGPTLKAVSASWWLCPTDAAPSTETPVKKKHFLKSQPGCLHTSSIITAALLQH